MRKKHIKIVIPAYNRPDYLRKTVDSLLQQSYSDCDFVYDFYVFEQSDDAKLQQQSVGYLVDNGINFAVSHKNLGLRGAFMKMYETGVFSSADYVMVTDQDNLFHQPISKLTSVLDDYTDCFVSTGYLSLEHPIDSVIKSEKHGTIIRKSLVRGGMTVMRGDDFRGLMPIKLDRMWGNPANSSWQIGFEWEETYWNPKSPGARGMKSFVYCVPNVCDHFGSSSTWRPDSEENRRIIMNLEIPQKEQNYVADQTALQPVLQKYPNVPR